VHRRADMEMGVIAGRATSPSGCTSAIENARASGPLIMSHCNMIALCIGACRRQSISVVTEIGMSSGERAFGRQMKLHGLHLTSPINMRLGWQSHRSFAVTMERVDIRCHRHDASRRGVSLSVVRPRPHVGGSAPSSDRRCAASHDASGRRVSIAAVFGVLIVGTAN